VNRAAALAAVAVGLSGPACQKQQEKAPVIDRVRTAPPAGSAASPAAEPASPAAEPASPEPRPIAELLAEAQRRGGGLLPSRIQIDYVGADGILDPAYARLEASFAPAAEIRPGDDPNRRTGAPVAKGPPPKVTQCPRVTWRGGRWETRQGGCTGVGARPTCTVQALWAKAIVQGAPPDAVAKLTYDGSLSPSQTAGSWRFAISDDVRDVHFRKSFPDDCRGMVEALDPTMPPDSALPSALDRQMIANAMGAVKSKVMSCARGDVKGPVRLKVKVKPDGTIDSATVMQTPDPDLGECVRAAILLAQFTKTQTGGSFTFPFVF